MDMKNATIVKWIHIRTDMTCFETTQDLTVSCQQSPVCSLCLSTPVSYAEMKSIFHGRVKVLLDFSTSSARHCKPGDYNT